MNTYDYLIWRPTDELYHHGIKGQKWGQQNGPPYPLDSSDHSAAEKKAAGSGSSSGFDSTSTKTSLKDKILKKSSSSSSKSSEEEKKKDSDEAAKKTNPKKSVKDMSDDELSKAIKRVEMEKKYKELTTPAAKEKTGLGKSIINGLGEVGGSIAKDTLKDIGKQTTSYVLGVEINKLLTKYNEKNGIDDKTSIDPKNIQNRSKKK